MRVTAKATHPCPDPCQVPSSQPHLLAPDWALGLLLKSLSLWAARQLEKPAAASPSPTGLPLCSGASSSSELSLPSRLLGGSRTETLLSALPCLLHQPPQLQQQPAYVSALRSLEEASSLSLQGPLCAVVNSKTPTHPENKFGASSTCLGVLLLCSLAIGY